MQALSQLHGPHGGAARYQGDNNSSNETVYAPHAASARANRDSDSAFSPKWPAWHRWARHRSAAHRKTKWVREFSSGCPWPPPNPAMTSCRAGADQFSSCSSCWMPRQQQQHLGGHVFAVPPFVISGGRPEKKHAMAAISRTVFARSRCDTMICRAAPHPFAWMPSRSKCQRSTGTMRAGGARIMCC